MDSKTLFSLAEADDAEGLAAALKHAPETYKIRNTAGETIYAFSVFRGRTKCVELLKTRGGLSLQDAALAGDLARLESLLDAAPWAIDMLSPDGWTAMHLAAFFGNDAIINALLDRGADASVMGRAFEQNLAMHAAAAGDRIGKAAFRRLVDATGVDTPQKQGYTALMIAASNNFADAIDVLLAAGADRTIKLADGKTAADIAKDRGHTELEKRLR
ncbi:MAG TPA: ankyrin repeat domain-containing protein [Rhizomicrobium sp.]|jgi:adenosylhomocysteine nucleosidase